MKKYMFLIALILVGVLYFTDTFDEVVDGIEDMFVSSNSKVINV